MKKAIIYIILPLTTVLHSSGQSKNEVVFEGLGMTSVIHCEVGEQVMKAKCPCSIPSEKKCFMYKFKVLKTIAYFENDAFTEEELTAFDFILIPSGALIESNNRYVITVQPSSSSKYIQYSKTLNIELNEDYNFKHKDGYLTSLVNCDQKDKFSKYFLSVDN